MGGPHTRPSVPRLPRGFPGIPVLDFTHLDAFLANAFAKIARTANSGLGLQFLLVYYAALFIEYYGNRIHPIKRPGCLEIKKRRRGLLGLSVLYRLGNSGHYFCQ